jgi:hypothetical protein
MNPLVAEYAGYVKFNPVEYTWIDLSNFALQYSDFIELSRQKGFAEPNGVLDMCLPEERIVVLLSIFNTKKSPIGVVLFTMVREDNVLTMNYYTNVHDGNVPSVTMILTETSENLAIRYLISKKYLKLSKLKEHVVRNETRDMFGIAVRALTYIAHTQTIVIGHTCTEDKAKNMRRKIMKRRPFFEWETVEIKPRIISKIGQGGTHASPKPHTRREHMRRKKDGTFTKVKSMIINKHKMPEEGFIFHDYKTSANTTGSTVH